MRPIYHYFFLVLLVSLVSCATPEKELQRELQANKMFYNARHSMEQGFPDQAREELLTSIQLNPSLPGPHFALAKIYMGAGKNVAAEREFQKALDLDDHFYEAYLGMGDLYIQQERFNDAIDIFRSLLKFAPFFPEFRTRNYLGWAFYKKGDYASALLALQKALSLAPHYMPARYNLGLTLYSLGRENASIREFRKAVELDPLSPSAHNWLGRIYLKRKMFEEALKEFRAVMANAPNETAKKNALEYVKIIKSLQGKGR